MRKKKLIYAVLALLTLGFTACQQEEDFAPQGGEAQEIRLATRATAFDGDNDGFTEGQVRINICFVFYVLVLSVITRFLSFR